MAGDIAVNFRRLDGDQDRFKMMATKQTTIKQIKRRVEMELGLEPAEQLIIFRGVFRKDENQEPFNVPELQDIIAEGGENGIQMAVMWRPFKLPAFLKKEKVEDINEKRKSGGTILHRAVRQTKISVAEEILADESFELVDTRDKSGQTALHTAVACRYRELARLILQCPRFTRVDAKDANDQTALHLAAHWGDEDTCQWICEHPLFKPEHARIRDQLGHTALAYATDCGHDEARKVILGFAPPIALEEDGSYEAEDDELGGSLGATITDAASPNGTDALALTASKIPAPPPSPRGGVVADTGNVAPLAIGPPEVPASPTGATEEAASTSAASPTRTAVAEEEIVPSGKPAAPPALMAPPPVPLAANSGKRGPLASVVEKAYSPTN
eukprot:TRINITY_DN25137_c0_g2_i1.p1 TRINITY_DN25137_c0_g2~~TRINITY_DN25137_c0_g2_i1.p1  ORF type:complete len:386 (-),score=76.55 TRINITY_DN25137_c0_g2_i1:55-1212(-)